MSARLPVLGADIRRVRHPLLFVRLDGVIPALLDTSLSNLSLSLYKAGVDGLILLPGQAATNPISLPLYLLVTGEEQFAEARKLRPRGVMLPAGLGKLAPVARGLGFWVALFGSAPDPASLLCADAVISDQDTPPLAHDSALLMRELIDQLPPLQLLRMAHALTLAGVGGIVVGRPVWSHIDPHAIACALLSVLRRTAGPEQAAGLLPSSADPQGGTSACLTGQLG